MLKKIISGHQTGADIAAIDAAMKHGLLVGGWVPKGRKTEAGPLPSKYKVQEMPGEEYALRTERNVIDSDGTAIFSHGPLSGGSELTKEYASKHGKPWMHLNISASHTNEVVKLLIGFLSAHEIKVLNVAGPRASNDGRIYGAVFAVIDSLLFSYRPLHAQ